MGRLGSLVMAIEPGPKDGPSEKQSLWGKLPGMVRGYILFCLVIGICMAYANHVGWFPTYGIFSGENSMHSGSHSGYHGGYGYGYGIHGK